MNSFLKIALRALLTFGVLCAVQYIIPYYLIAVAAIVAGFFMLKTGDDRETALGILVGGIAFGIFAVVMAQYFPVAG